MGREAHLLRLALGRSADEPPEWPALTDHFQAEGDLYIGIDPLKPSYGRYYDRKGRPVNFESRERNWKLCDAQNNVLTVAGICEENISKPDIEHSAQNTSARSLLPSQPQLSYENIVSRALIWFIFEINTYWIGNIESQLQTFSSFNSVSFTQLVTIQRQTYGTRSFLFAGFPCGVMAMIYTFSSILSFPKLKNHETSFNGLFRHGLYTETWHQGLRYLSFEVFFLVPLIAYYELQRLHLLSSSPFIPPLNAFNPLSTASPIWMKRGSALTFASTASIMTFFAFKRAHVRNLIETRAERLLFRFMKYEAASETHLESISSGSFPPSLNALFTRLRISSQLAVCRMLSITHRLFSWSDPDPYDEDNVTALNYTAILAQASKTVIVETLTQTIMWPVYGIMLRTIVYAFLAGASTPLQRENSNWYRADLYAIFSGPLTGLSPVQLKSDAKYWTKIGLCFGLRLVSNLSLCCLQGATALWFGRKFLKLAGPS